MYLILIGTHRDCLNYPNRFFALHTRRLVKNNPPFLTENEMNRWWAADQINGHPSSSPRRGPRRLLLTEVLFSGGISPRSAHPTSNLASGRATAAPACDAIFNVDNETSDRWQRLLTASLPVWSGVWSPQRGKLKQVLRSQEWRSDALNRNKTMVGRVYQRRICGDDGGRRRKGGGRRDRRQV